MKLNEFEAPVSAQDSGGVEGSFADRVTDVVRGSPLEEADVR